ncbi:MAG TPA: hypothetical protein VMM92_09010, partial [Thermoanaerobaculia bacterium]|nr:hypothetical protein [Thermoanaerobaculia bacterium]
MEQNPADLLIDDRYLAGSTAACEYIQVLAAQILWRLGFGDLPPVAQPLPSAALGVLPELGFALAWLLEEA